MQRLLVIYLVILCVLPLSAQNYNEYLEAAEKHFNSGNYEKAVSAYNVYKKLTGKTVTKYEEISSSNLDNIQGEYNQLVSKATECFNKKRFIEARKYYDEAVRPEYHEFYNKVDFEWISLCDSILVAQNQNEAITPQLAAAFKNISLLAEPTGFSDGVIVIDQKYGHLTLITTDGGKKELTDAFVSPPTLFSENKLSVNLNNSSCFINKEGVIVLNWRKSDYNNLFNIKDYEFSNFEGECAYVTDGNGKYGLIDLYGHTMLLPQKKYKPYILKDRIILYDGTNIFCHYRQKLKNGDQITKYMYKLFRCKGMVYDVTEDYIIICEYGKHKENDKYKIYSFDSGKIYTTKNWIRAISSNLVLLRDENDYNFLWDFEKNIKIELGRQWYGENGNNLVFEYGQPLIIGSRCYDINGELLFSFTEDVKVANVGFTDGYLLIRKSNNKYCYIDKKGKILADYEFEIPKSAEHLIQYYFRKPFGNGFGLIVKDGKWGLIDRFGTTTFDYQY